MAQPIIKPSFAAGELSPSLYARVDLEKYHSGAALLRNFFVDFRGGVMNRAGTSFAGFCLDGSKPNRLIPFQFNLQQAYALVFGDYTMRVVKAGGLVLEPAIAITDVANSAPAQLTVGPNQLSAGDWVYVDGIQGPTELNGKTYKLTSAGVISYTFTPTDDFGNTIDGTGFPVYDPDVTAGYLRKHVGKALILPNYAISAITQTNPCTVTVSSAAALNFTDADSVSVFNTGTPLDNLNFLVRALTGFPTVLLLAKLDGTPVDATSLPAYISGGTVARVFTLATPYPATDLALLKYAQSADVMTLTHVNYPPQRLTRTAHYAWSLTPLVFGSQNTAPTGVAAQAYNGGATGAQSTYIYVVTTVGAKGTGESRPSLEASVIAATMSSVTGSKVTVSWSPVPGAVQYNIYRTPENANGAPEAGSLFGFVGSATGNATSFIDANVTPDFSLTPPLAYDPFSVQQVDSISVVAGGTGYTAPTVIILDAAGDGAQAHATLSGGAIATVVMDSAGEGYVNPIVVVSEGLGIGAVGSVNLTAGRVASVQLQSGGAAYTKPVAVVVDPTGAGAALTANVTTGGAITRVILTSPGSTQPANIGAHISDPTGTGAVLAVRSHGLPGSIFDTHVIDGIDIINGGSGYTAPTVVFDNAITTVPTADAFFEDDVVASVTVTAAGSNYTNPILYIYDAIGQNAQLEAVLSSANNNPGCTCFYDGRQVFAGSLNHPDTIWMSKVGDYLNMDYSSPSRDDDSVQASLLSQQVNAIQHLVPITSLLPLTTGGAWKLDGGSQSDIITPTHIRAKQQAYNGCSQQVPPLVVTHDVLYVQSKGAVVRDLTYNFYADVYTGADMSVLANHLFAGRQIVEWAWSEEPHKIVWCVRDDGLALSFSYLKEQEVYGWARHDTLRGRFRSVCSISEGDENAVYFIVQRTLGGRVVQTIERLASRELGGDVPIGVPGSLRKAWFVDCGVASQGKPGASNLTPNQTEPIGKILSVAVIDGGSGYVAPQVAINDPTGTGATAAAAVTGGVITEIIVTNAGQGYTDPTVTIVDSAGSDAVAQTRATQWMSFTSDVPIVTVPAGAILDINGGYGTLLQMSPMLIEADMRLPPASANTAAAGDWTLTTPQDTFGGLDHLEGESVAILADGNVQGRQVVVDGKITLLQPAAFVVAGLPIQAQVKSLYLATGAVPTDQTKRKKINAVTVRVKDTRGLSVGHDFDDTLVEVKDRTTEIDPGVPVPLYTGDQRVTMDPLWNERGQIVAQQDDPLPAHILGLIMELSIGDTE